MNARLRPNVLSGLHWVRGEIEQSLSRVRTLVEQHAENHAEPLPLQQAFVELHQVRGTAGMIQCHGVAAIAEEMKLTIGDLLHARTRDAEAAYAALVGCTVLLTEYIEALAEGMQDCALVLQPAMNELRLARGKPVLTEADLFALQLQAAALMLPLPEDDSRVPGAIEQSAQKYLSPYQASLLSWLKEQDDAPTALARIGKISEMLALQATHAAVHQLWRVMAATVEALLGHAMDDSLDLKRLVGRTVNQLRELATQGETSAANAVGDLPLQLLYYIGRSKGRGPRVTVLRKAFQLPQLLPSLEQLDEYRRRVHGPNTALLNHVAGEIRQEFAKVKDVVDLAVRLGGKHGNFEQTQQSLKRIGDTLSVLGLVDLQRVVANQIRMLDQVLRDDVHAGSIWMELATSILRVEHSLEDALFKQLRNAEDGHVDALYRVPHSRDLSEGIDALYRESLVNLAKLRTFVDNLERGQEPSTMAVLEAIKLVEEIAAVFRILQDDRAAALTGQLADYVRGTRFADMRDNRERAERFADAIVSVEYYVEGKRSRVSEPATLLDNLARCVEQLDLPVDVPLADASVALEQTTRLDLVDPSDTLALAGEAPSETADELRAAAEPATAAEARPSPGASALPSEDVDPEIREVFLDEAGEVLLTLQAASPRWKRDPEDREALVTIRRAFHTLKGSGRMVGAHELGEFSWAVEQLLNKCLDGSLAISAPIATVVEEAIGLLPTLIAQFRAGEAADPAALRIIEQAQNLAAGRAVEAQDEPDLIGIFCDDAREKLVSINHWLAEQPRDQGRVQIEDLPLRAYHTLKGAGYVVAANAIGDLAGALEAHLEALIAADTGLRADDFRLLEDANAQLLSWLDELRRPGAAQHQDARVWISRLEQSRGDVPEGAVEAAEERQLAEIFCGEALDLVQSFEATVQAWEQAPDNRQAPEELRVVMHTLKGAAYMSNCKPVGDVAKVLHTHLDRCIAQQIRPSERDFKALKDLIEGVYQQLDAYREHRLRPDDGTVDQAQAFVWTGESQRPQMPPADDAFAPDPATTRAPEQPLAAQAEDAVDATEPQSQVAQPGTCTDGIAEAMPDVVPHENHAAVDASAQHADAFEAQAVPDPAEQPEGLPQGELDVQDLASALDGLDSAEISGQNEIIDLSAELPGETALSVTLTGYDLADFDLSAEAAGAADAPAAGEAEEEQRSDQGPTPDADASQPSPGEYDAEAEQAYDLGSADPNGFVDEAEALLAVLVQQLKRIEFDPEDLNALQETREFLRQLQDSARASSYEGIAEVAQQLDILLTELALGQRSASESFFARLEAALDGLYMALEDVRSGAQHEVLGLEDWSEPSENAVELGSEPDAAEAWTVFEGQAPGDDKLPSTDIEPSAEADAQASTDFDPSADAPTFASNSGDAIGEAAQPDVGDGAGWNRAFDAAAEWSASASRLDAVDPVAGEAASEAERGEHRALELDPNDLARSPAPDSVGQWPLEDLNGQEPEPANEVASPALASPAEWSDGADYDEELGALFSSEAAELLEALNLALQALRSDSGNVGPLRELQRVLHTLKGGARMAGLMLMGDVAHDMETRVNRFESGLERADAAALDDLEAYAERLHQLHDLLERGEVATLLQAQPAAAAPKPAQTDPLPVAITTSRDEDAAASALADTPAPAGELAEAAVSADLAAPAEAPRFGSEWDPLLFWRPDEEVETTLRRETARVSVDVLDGMLNEAGEISIFRSRLEEQNAALQTQLAEMAQAIARIRDQLRQLDVETEAQIAARGISHSSTEHDRYAAEFDPLEMDRYTRMQELSRALSESVGDLNNLHGVMDQLAGEAESILLQQGRVTTAVQQGLMRTLMVPFSRQVGRLQRVVRQTAADNGKQAEVDFSGVDSELDRNVLERMTAPLEHLLRNAVVHGIEDPDTRVAAGKPAQGQIQVKLWREGSQLLIELRDDGRGLDFAAIRAQAVRRGLMPADAQLSDDESAQFIFQPGFSTAKKLTQDAGRGIGMDVVASEVKQLGGTLELTSQAGQGTRFLVRLPLTLAMSQALLLAVGHEQYAILLNNVEGIARIPREQLDELYSEDGKTFLYGGAEYRVRYLGDFIGIPRDRSKESRTVPVVIVRLAEGLGAERRLAVVVDHLIGNREIVTKAVGPQVSSINGVSGATILADGRVVLILDPAALAQERARRALSALVQRRSEVVRPEEDARALIMVVDDSITIRRVTERLLLKNGYRVLTAKDGLDAMARLQSESPAAILLDIEMPRADGFEVATFVRNTARIAHTPIIMITSRSGDKHRDRARAIGVNRYMIKPYQEDQLMDELRDVLQETAR